VSNIEKRKKPRPELTKERRELLDQYLSGTEFNELCVRNGATPMELRRQIRDIFLDMASKSVSDQFDAYAAQLLMDELIDLAEKEKELKMRYKRKFDALDKDGVVHTLEEDASDAILVPKFKSEKRQLIVTIRAILAKSSLADDKDMRDASANSVDRIVGAFSEVMIRQAKDTAKLEDKLDKEKKQEMEDTLDVIEGELV
jgi:hypothetical protein